MDDCAEVDPNALVYGRQCVAACPEGTVAFERRCLDACFQHFETQDGGCVQKKAANHSSSWIGAGVALAVAVIFGGLTALSACRRCPRAGKAYDSYVLKRGVELHDNTVGPTRRE